MSFLVFLTPLITAELTFGGGLNSSGLTSKRYSKSK